MNSVKSIDHNSVHLIICHIIIIIFSFIHNFRITLMLNNSDLCYRSLWSLQDHRKVFLFSRFLLNHLIFFWHLSYLLLNEWWLISDLFLDGLRLLSDWFLNNRLLLCYDLLRTWLLLNQIIQPFINLSNVRISFFDHHNLALINFLYLFLL